MTAYWLMFLVPVLATMSPFRGTLQLRRVSWLLVGFLLCYLIGLRHQIGGDWYSYLDQFNGIAELPFMRAVAYSDIEPGFNVLMWLVTSAGLGIYTLNLACAFIFVVGLVVFCRQQPLPWLALAIAVPYLITVVAMGYTRQSAALGFLFLALAEYRSASQLRFIVWVAVAALFHKAALLMLPMGILVSTSRYAIKAAAILSLFVLIVVLLLAEQYDVYWHNYVEVEMQSEGGPIRVLMNAVAAIVFLVTRKYWRRRWADTTLWIALSLLSLVFVVLVQFASTAIDRLAIFLIPLQIFVFSRLPLLVSNTMNRTLAVLGILAAYASVLWVWLNFAVHAQYWLPYKNVTFLPFVN